MLAQISLSDNPCCQFINDIPQWVFLIIHILIFVVALTAAVRSFGAENRTAGWAFTLFALAEVSYLTYHVNLTLFLLAHTISEVFALLGIILLGGAVLGARAGRQAGSR